MNDHEVISTIVTRKCKIAPDQRMAAKSLLLAHFPDLMNGGQLIIHFGPGRVPVWIEVQERADSVLERSMREQSASANVA